MPAPSNSTPPARCTAQAPVEPPAAHRMAGLSRALPARARRHPLPAVSGPAGARGAAARQRPTRHEQRAPSPARRNLTRARRARRPTLASTPRLPRRRPSRCLRSALRAAAAAFPGRPRAPFAHPCTHDTRVGLLVPPAGGAYNFHTPAPLHTGRSMTSSSNPPFERTPRARLRPRAASPCRVTLNYALGVYTSQLGGRSGGRDTEVHLKVTRIVCNIESQDLAQAQSFYGDILGLALMMDLGWDSDLRFEGNEAVQISVLSEGGSGTPVPELSYRS